MSKTVFIRQKHGSARNAHHLLHDPARVFHVMQNSAFERRIKSPIRKRQCLARTLLNQTCRNRIRVHCLLHQRRNRFDPAHRDAGPVPQEILHASSRPAPHIQNARYAQNIEKSTHVLQRKVVLVSLAHVLGVIQVGSALVILPLHGRCGSHATSPPPSIRFLKSSRGAA